MEEWTYLAGAQCKAEKKKVGPKYVRELEGVLHRYHMSSGLGASQEHDDASSHTSPVPPSRNSPHHTTPSMGLFISESPFTKAAVIYAQSSLIPLLLIHLPPEHEDTVPSACKTDLGTAIWNSALAGNQGLLGGHMEIRWERSNHQPGRPGLWWENTRLPSWIPEVTYPIEQ